MQRAGIIVRQGNQNRHDTTRIVCWVPAGDPGLNDLKVLGIKIENAFDGMQVGDAAYHHPSPVTRP